MRKTKFTEEQIAMALRQAEAGTPVEEICRKLGVSAATFFRWKRVYGSLGVPELRELRQLRDENKKLKQLVADLSLDKTILQEAMRKNGEARAAPSGSGVGPRGVCAQRAAHLPCSGRLALELSLSERKASAGAVASTDTRARRRSGARGLPPAPHVAAPGGLEGQPQARV